MSYLHFPRLLLAFSITLLFVAGDVFAEPNPSNPSNASNARQPFLDVYKSPTCGCCGEWISHVQTNGYQSRVHHPDDLAAVKNKYRIGPELQSCHTAVSAEGYVFEGHIPASLITRFLAEKPEGALGLAVPGMPVGSPGMEMGERFTPYDVLLLKADGSSVVYTRITSLKQSR